jgi:hypothetical protein
MTAAVTAIVIKVISGPSDVFAADCERETDAHTGEPQHKHRRQPNEQVHQGLLIVAATRAVITGPCAADEASAQKTRVCCWAASVRTTSARRSQRPVPRSFDDGKLVEAPVNLPYRLGEANVKNA